MDAITWGPVLSAVGAIVVFRLTVRLRPWRPLLRVVRRG